MDFKFLSASASPQATQVHVVFEENELSAAAKACDKALGGSLTRALETNRFKGKKGEVLSLVAPQGSQAPRILLLGLGKRSELTDEKLISAGGSLCGYMRSTPDQAVEIFSDCDGNDTAGAQLAYGMLLRSWRFDKYFTKEAPEKKLALKTVHLISQKAKESEASFLPLAQIAEGVFLTRGVVTEPPNVLYPASMAERMQELTKLGVKVEVLGLKEITKLGMGALLGVAQGSAQEPKVIVLRWEGGAKDEQPVAFVGKGVTFDTGGISLKPSAGMGDMKYDMAGSAVVAGVIRALAGRKAKVNAVGVMGMVENMPSGTAQRPSDVVTSMSGQTIEIMDTDAEGRLVLGDVLWYTQDRFKPEFMVNLATLTGAIVIALGDTFAGLFSNDDKLSEQLTAVGERTGERLWRMPLDEEFDRAIDSDIADMKNLGNGRKAGSCTAGQFLKRFVNDTPWAHLDIAGTTWAEKSLPTAEKGATAFGVRLLDALVKNHYEAK